MKVFIKILTISVVVQSIGFLSAFALDKLMECKGSSSVVAILPAFLGIVISITFSIFLSFRWYSTLKAKIIAIIIMPTNYIFIFIVILFIKLMAVVGDILHNFPSNFG